MRPSKPAAEMTQAELAAYIDYSILKPEFTTADVEREIRTAVELGCKTVCINPAYIETALPLVKGTGTGICVVIDFPFGTSSTRSKVAQAKIALEHPIEDLDIVMNYGWLRGGETERVTEDLRAVVELCHAKGVIVKTIMETDALTDDEIRAAAEAAIAAGADFIKTSTGFYTGEPQHAAPGASDEMVALMMEAAAGRCLVKGSAAIRDRDHFLRLIDAGIDRMGIGYRSTPVVLGLSGGAGIDGTGY